MMVSLRNLEQAKIISSNYFFIKELVLYHFFIIVAVSLVGFLSSSLIQRKE